MAGYYDLTNFGGYTLVDSYREMVSMVETEVVIARTWILENGAKFDADGVSVADTRLGQIIARYQVIGAAVGMFSFNAGIGGYTDIKGRRLMLTGKQYYGASTITLTCDARCIAVDPEPYIAEPGSVPMNATARQKGYVVVVWEKFTEWA